MRLSALLESLDFVPFSELSSADLHKVLEIRNQDVVRQNMYTSHLITSDEHERWAASVLKNPGHQYFAIMQQDLLVGVVSLNNIHFSHKRADWAYYVDQNLTINGLGAAIEFKFLNYVFDELSLLKLNCEVLSFNGSVIALHEKFGLIIEGTSRAHIIRAGESIDAVLLGITRGEWDKKRSTIFDRYFSKKQRS